MHLACKTFSVSVNLNVFAFLFNKNIQGISIEKNAGLCYCSIKIEKMLRMHTSSQMQLSCSG